jgi:hypothetical protein
MESRTELPDCWGDCAMGVITPIGLSISPKPFVWKHFAFHAFGHVLAELYGG